MRRNKYEVKMEKDLKKKKQIPILLERLNAHTGIQTG